jgi:hypothetical protein
MITYNEKYLVQKIAELEGLKWNLKQLEL